tara:strand:- start:114 stop:395 length:282 start_codon:yes stop_codon:yes gene_type:complete
MMIIFSVFGFNLLLSFLGNILLLAFLIPLLFLLLIFVSFNFYKSKINTCTNCGAILIGSPETCINCGSDLDKRNQLYKKPSESTIEVMAEEVK